MLRLRPSELTLTPDDVEETFRRIALRQPTRPQSSLPLRPFGQPGRPILRRGPQRATRDAVTALGKIPLLQPQQALVTSVDDSCEHTAAHEDISPIDRDSSNNQHVESVTSDHATQDGPAHLPASSASRAVEVALRACGESTAQSPPNGTACNAPCTPQRQLSESQRSGSADMSGDYALSAVESTPGLRGGGHGKPSGDPIKSSGQPRKTLFLRGYVESTATGDVYNFHESWESEPRRGSAREVPATRSRSAGPSLFPWPTGHSHVRASNDDPFSTQSRLPTAATRPNNFLPMFSMRPNESIAEQRRPIPADWLFPNTRQTSGSSQRPTRTRTRSRHFGSDTSVASVPYSYYGSLPPESRHNSSENPAAYSSHYPFVDGAAGWNESIQPSPRMHPHTGYDTPAAYAFGPTVGDASTFSSPYMTHAGLHGPSPLPASPYTRTQHNPANPSPVLASMRNSPRGFIDAATAASRNLPSPLDPMANQYQRRMQATTNRQTEDTRTIASFTSRSQGSQMRRSSQARSPSYNPHLPSWARNPGFSQPRHNISGHDQSPFAAHMVPMPPYATHTYGTVMLPTRDVQVSSENAPAHPSRATRISTVQEHRAAYERLQTANRTTPTNAARDSSMQPFRHSMPQASISDDRSNRSRVNALHNFTTADQSHHRTEERSYSRASTYHHHRRPSPGQSQPVLNANAPEFTPNLANPPPPRQHGSEPSQRLPTRAYRPGPGATHLQPTRDSPLTALALDQGSGTTSRRSRSPLTRGTMTVRTHRRVPPEQRDQENDGDRSMMRRAEGDINARYGEDEQQRTTMNETPPRTGPIERRMHD